MSGSYIFCQKYSFLYEEVGSSVVERRMKYFVSAGSNPVPLFIFFTKGGGCMSEKATKVKITHERWNDYTKKDVDFIIETKCRGCTYLKKLQAMRGEGSTMYCNYISIVGHRRGCRPDECDKYEKRTGDNKERTPWYETYK